MANIEFGLNLPSEPLEGNLYISNQFRDLLGPEFLEGVYNALRFSADQTVPVYNAGGRNYYIPLPKSHGPYDALQIAGGGNLNLGITTNADVQDGIVEPKGTAESLRIEAPSAEAGLFTSFTTYYEDGKLTEKTNINPIGAYTARSAGRKIEQTKKAFELLPARKNGVITPMYVAKYEYDIADQFGEPQTAILMMVPSMGRRFDSKLLLPLDALRKGQAPAPGAEFAKDLEPYYEAVVLPSLSSIGFGIARIHESGLAHHQLTPGNTDTLAAPGGKLVPYVTDWDTAKIPGEADRPRTQALDVLVALQTASSGLKRLARQETVDKETAAGLVLESSLSILEGYYRGRGGLYNVRVDPKEAVGVAANGQQLEKSLDVVESWLA